MCVPGFSDVHLWFLVRLVMVAVEVAVVVLAVLAARIGRSGSNARRQQPDPKGSKAHFISKHRYNIQNSHFFDKNSCFCL